MPAWSGAGTSGGTYSDSNCDIVWGHDRHAAAAAVSVAERIGNEGQTRETSNDHAFAPLNCL